MTISIVGAGAVGEGTTTAAAAYVAGATTDIILAMVLAKPYTIADPTSAAYSLLGSATSGTVADGIDVGSVKLAAYRRTGAAPTGASTNTFTVTGGSTAAARTVRLASNSQPFVADAVVPLTDTVETGTGVSAGGTAGAGVIAAGDFLCVFVGIKSDTPNHTAQSLTVAGCTLGTVTWTKAQGTGGNDHASYVGTCQVTDGSSTGTVTYAATSSVSGASSVAAEVVRVRDTKINPTGTVAAISAATATVSRSVAAGTIAAISAVTAATNRSAVSGVVAVASNSYGTVVQPVASFVSGVVDAVSSSTGTVARSIVAGTSAATSSSSGTVDRSNTSGTVAAVSGGAGTVGRSATAGVIAAVSDSTATVARSVTSGTTAAVSGSSAAVSRSAASGTAAAVSSSVATVARSATSGTVVAITTVTGTTMVPAASGFVVAVSTATGSVELSSVNGTVVAFSSSVATVSLSQVSGVVAAISTARETNDASGWVRAFSSAFGTTQRAGGSLPDDVLLERIRAIRAVRDQRWANPAARRHGGPQLSEMDVYGR